MAFRGAGGIASAWGAWVQRWCFFNYPIAAGTYYPLTGETDAWPGVGGVTLQGAFGYARIRVPFDVVPQRLTVFQRLNVNVGQITYALRNLDDTVTIATVVQDTAVPSYYDATTVFAVGALARDDILNLRVTKGVLAGITAGSVIVTLTGYRTGV